MVKNSIYRAIYKRNESRLYTGFDYRGQIFKRTLSEQMFGINPTLDSFIGMLDSYFYELIESIKQVKIFANPALDKYENSIN